MEEIKVKPNEVVVPGETLAVGMGFLPSFGTYREGETIKCKRLGLLNVEGKVLKIIPVSGSYLPKKGDVIIAKAIDILMSGWKFDFGSAYPAVLSLKEATSEFVAKGADLTRYYNIGDWVATKIVNVTSQNLVDISMKGPGLRKLRGGKIVKITPNKVPRVIGKQGSMVSMIKNHTNCHITVGQNGLIWLDGEPESVMVAVKAIEMIDEKAHISGLTDKVKEFLEKESKNKGAQKEAEPKKAPKLR